MWFSIITAITDHNIRDRKHFSLKMLLLLRFDERKSECSLPIEYLSYAPVIAVVGALICAILAGGHLLMRCLPPLADSFFIFNANEDNRLCIDPIFKPPEQVPFEVNKVKRTSLIPVSNTHLKYDNVH